MKQNILKLTFNSPISVSNGGLMVSRGQGIHPDRTINSHELIYVDRGILGMFEGDNTFTVNPGESLLLFPGRKHGGTLPYGKDLRFYWIHFNIEQKKPETTVDLISVPQHNAVTRPERMVELYRLYLDDQESGSGQGPGADLLLMQLLFEAAVEGKSPDTESSHIAGQVKVFIQTHFHENISTVDIAHELNINPDYLGRVFKKNEGTTITDAIHTTRLKFARNLLLHSADNINEIADRAGFSDPGYFRRLFKRKMGTTPARYRKTYSRIHVNTQ